MTDIRKLTREELEAALPLVWEVFNEFEAVNYPEDGKQAFYQAIHDPAYLDMLEAYGAYGVCEGPVNESGAATGAAKLLGIIASRSQGSHVALFFVDGKQHRKGIGRQLWETLLADSKADIITVHSSLYAEPVYARLGFLKCEEVQEEGGMQFVPMEYRRA